MALLTHAVRGRGRLALLGVLASCGAEPSASPPSGTTRSAIIHGAVSGPEEDFVVYLEVAPNIDAGESKPRRCSGTLLAPNVVLTARHCLLRKDNQLVCTPDGEEVTDLANPPNLTPAAPEDVRVYYGMQRSSFTSAGTIQVFASDTLGVCKNDVALVVLERALADVHVPVRLSPVRVGELITVSGWGLTDDPKTSPEDSSLPERRMTRTAVRIEEVGPGLIPPGTFAIAGATTCFGDSGTAARVDGAVVGVYSYIQGPCTLPESRNVFMMTAAQRALIDAAFTRAGAVPWYAGEPPPWLAPVGAACTSDAACQLGRCDVARGVCATPCGSDAGASCSSGEVCDAARGVCTPGSGSAPAPAAPPESSCALTDAAGRRGGTSYLLAVFGIVLAIETRRRQWSRPSVRKKDCDA